MWITDNVKIKKNKKIITFELIANEWIENKRKDIKESSLANYLYIIRKYLMIEFRDYTLENLEKNNFNEYVDELNQDLKPKTIRDILIVLKSILNYANEKYKCSIKIGQIKAPKLEQDIIVILSKDEKTKLEKYCLKQKSLKSLGIIICLNTGIRIGEICALKWKNIDLDKKEICIRNTLQRIYDEELKGTKVIIGKPKTNASVRNIPISNKVCNILKELRNKYGNEDYFLTGNARLYIEPRAYRENFKSFLRKSRLRTTYRFHILRHTFATDCIGVGMDIKSLSEILGHTTVEITLNRYVHSSFERKIKYLEKI